jgi:hypothetical protein
MLKWEVQHFTLLDGFVNTWTEEFDGEELPIYFDTEQEAEQAIDVFLADVEMEIRFGWRDAEAGYNPSEFRVWPVQTSRDIAPLGHAVGHKTGTLHGLSADQIATILNNPQVPDDESKVRYSWAFKSDGYECGVWDYYGSGDRLNFSTYGPSYIFKDIFGDHYEGRGTDVTSAA